MTLYDFNPLVMLVSICFNLMTQGSPHLATTCRNRPPNFVQHLHVSSGLCPSNVSSNMIETSCTNRIWMGKGFFQQAMFHETRGVCPSYGFYQPNGHAGTTPGKSLFLGSSVTNLGLFIEVLESRRTRKFSVFLG